MGRGNPNNYLPFDGSPNGGSANAYGIPGTTGGLISANSVLTIAAQAAFDLNGGIQSVVALVNGSGGGGAVINSNAALPSVLTLTPTGTSSFGGMIEGGGALGTISLVINGSGTQILTAANTYTGSTTINAGTLQLGDNTSGHDASLATSGITNNAALVYDVFASQAANYAISGSGSLTKIGGGTLVIGGSNNNTGPTNVNAGTLQVGNNGLLSAASLVTVGSGAKLALAGNGQLASTNILIQPGGLFDATAAPFFLAAGQTLSAGRSSSPATDLSGNITLSGGVLDIGIGTGTIATLTAANGTLALSSGTVNFDLTSKATSVGGTNDVVAVANLAITGSTTLAINATTLAPGNGTYPLFNFGTLSGGTSSLIVDYTNLVANGTRQNFSLVTTGAPTPRWNLLSAALPPTSSGAAAQARPGI